MSVKSSPISSTTQRIVPSAQKAYVGLMMDVIARALVSASQIDGELHGELEGFKAGTTIQMIVLPKGANFTIQVQEDKTLKRVDLGDQKPDLSVKFKHLSHAFLVLSFQESTAQAYANDRMVVDGDTGYATRFVRCLNQLEALILPKLVADLAVKRYPTELGIGEKFNKAAQIYLNVAGSYAELLPKAAQFLSQTLSNKTIKRS
ncbi:hypothetical protein [Aquirhabdus sp.]|uniref:hypothetical protein n=1 Tax=Aquirhabdus sp. TaxID=2824160 RepID=UPI00396C71F8